MVMTRSEYDLIDKLRSSSGDIRLLSTLKWLPADFHAQSLCTERGVRACVSICTKVRGTLQINCTFILHITHFWPASFFGELFMCTVA